MNGIKIDIENFDEGCEPTTFDLLCVEKIDYLHKVNNYSLVTIQVDTFKIRIRFDWKEDEGIDESDFLYIAESATMFFRCENQWGAIDVQAKMLKRHECSHWKPFIERKGCFILVEDDLLAESTRLNGERIDSVPIDPPTERKEYDDRIEYSSPVFGRQVLKTK
ncbi:hypothetical protein [Pseudochryseolinea flava]|uniref:Uncharacterized protein n=1 Tax=Pseudochryseolinea flava TaxID=2059302 RepID=A0A364Y7U5_9BACT|nr:hypothetical protein [Pseudochryseolinea flava]RAW02204.1 hypothetical protein DQQ10_06590 [Pseudochryseolinea flava]